MATRGSVGTSDCRTCASQPAARTCVCMPAKSTAASWRARITRTGSPGAGGAVNVPSTARLSSAKRISMARRASSSTTPATRQ